MKAEDRALSVMIVAIVVFVGIGGAYLLLRPPSLRPSSTLPLPIGTTFTPNDTLSWAAYFNVTTLGARLVGAWTAYNGIGFPYLWVVNGSVPKPPIDMFHCPVLWRWVESNGSIDAAIDPGPHTAFWGVCFGASRIVITEPVQVVPRLYL